MERVLARDRELRERATPRPWHHDGSGAMLRLLGPLPRATVVVDPYTPNPQDGALLLHRVNTYEDLESEIERLTATLRTVRMRLDETRNIPTELPTDEVLHSLTSDLRAGITAALGDRQDVHPVPGAARRAR